MSRSGSCLMWSVAPWLATEETGRLSGVGRLGR